MSNYENFLISEYGNFAKSYLKEKIIDSTKLNKFKIISLIKKIDNLNLDETFYDIIVEVLIDLVFELNIDLDDPSYNYIDGTEKNDIMDDIINDFKKQELYSLILENNKSKEKFFIAYHNYIPKYNNLTIAIKVRDLIENNYRLKNWSLLVGKYKNNKYKKISLEEIGINLNES